MKKRSTKSTAKKKGSETTAKKKTEKTATKKKSAETTAKKKTKKKTPVETTEKPEKKTAAKKKSGKGKTKASATQKKTVKKSTKKKTGKANPSRQPIDMKSLQRVEEATQRIGRELWDHIDRRQPTVFERRWWLDHILEWAMQDESVKVQMFRFVDVLPTLKSSESVTAHLQEYFDEVSTHLPTAARMGLEIAQPDTLLGKALAINARNNTRKMAERFIAGTRSEEVYRSVHRLRNQGLAFTLDLLGEAVVSDAEAAAYQSAYLDLISDLAPRVNAWPEDPVLDRDQHGWIPKCQVSLKLSALVSHFKPIASEETSANVKEQLRSIFRLARDVDAYVHIDMEHYEYKDLTLQIFKEICMEEEFRDWPDCGIVIQAYLPDAERDLDELLEWVKERGTPIGVRLVKGAYWDYETIQAEYRGWPCPVYTEKWQSDANFEKQTQFLLENHEYLRPAIASHNLRSIANAIAWAEEFDLPQNSWEIQMLFGMAEEQQHLFSELGQRVRVYAPFGQMLPGMSYLVRRLLENTSNESFLRSAYEQEVSIDELLRTPEDVGKLAVVLT